MDLELGLANEDAGIFWPAGEPEKGIPGKLSLGSDGIKLSTLATPLHKDLNPRPSNVIDTIHGAGHDAFWTLFRSKPWLFAFESGITTFPSRCDYALAGAHINSFTDSVVSKISFAGRNVGPLLGLSPVDQKIEVADEGVSIQLRNKATKLERCIADGVTLSGSFNLNTARNEFRQYGFETAAFFAIEFADPKSVKECLVLFDAFQSFSSLCVGAPTVVKKIDLDVVGDDEEQARLFFPVLPVPDQQEIDLAYVPASWADNEEVFASAFEKFIEVDSKLSDPIGLLNATEVGPIEPNVSLILLTQALESIHRQTLGGDLISADKYMY